MFFQTLKVLTSATTQ